MKIKTHETLRQLAYAKRVAEELSDILAKEDDDKFNVVAFELAKALVGRIEHAVDMLNFENDALNEEEAIHSAAKKAKEAAKAKAMKAKAMCDFGYALGA